MTLPSFRTGIKRRPDIDGLRATAVILVLGFHAFPNVFPGGFVGVDVFFVISGFLITSIIAEGIESGRFDFLQFYARRARRLFPALVVVLVTALAAGWLLLTPGQLEALGKQTAATTLFVPNFLFWSERGYFDAAASTKPLLHMWSLGVEEQFYLVWPALMVVMVRLGQRLGPVLVAITALSLGYSEYLAQVDPVAAFYSPLSRAWELSVGGLIAARRVGKPALPVVANLAVCCGLAIILFMACRMKPGGAFPGFSALPVVFGAALVVLFGDLSSWARLSLGSSPFSEMGLVSYPLYLWHVPILTFAYLAADAPLSAFASSIALLASIALAFLTHYAIELPLTDTMSLRRSAMASTAILAGVGLSGVAIDIKRGYPERLPVEIRKAVGYERYDFKTPALWEICWLRNDIPPDKMLILCLKTAREDGLVVWGDSHAAMLAAGLRTDLGAERISQLTKSSCPPILKDELFASCRSQNDAVFEAIKKTLPKTVILFSYWQAYASDWRADSLRASRLAQTIEAIKHAGISNVVLMGPPPIFKPSLPSRLFHRWIWSRTIDDRLKLENIEAITEIDGEMASIAKNSGAEYASLLRLMCNDQGCLTRIPGTNNDLVAFDYGHMTGAAAAFVSKAIIRPIVDRPALTGN